MHDGNPLDTFIDLKTTGMCHLKAKYLVLTFYFKETPSKWRAVCLKIKIPGFWDMAPCNLKWICQRFGRDYCIHRLVKALLPRPYVYIHPVMLQKTGIFNNTEMQTIKPVQFKNICCGNFPCHRKTFLYLFSGGLVTKTPDRIAGQENVGGAGFYSIFVTSFDLQRLVLCVGFSPNITPTRLEL